MKNLKTMYLLFPVLALLFTAALPTQAEEKIGGLPLPSSGNVTLSLEEYNRLVELASKTPKKPEVAPLPYAIKNAALKFRVDNESVLGTVQLEGEVFKKGETRVPLVDGLTVLDAHQQGRTMPLEQDNGTHVAILSGPAEFSVALDAGLPLRIEAGRATFALPVPPAGSAQLTLTLPGDHANVSINPGLITSRTSQNGQTVIEATLVPGRPANVWWTTREVAAPVVPHEVRFLSDVQTLVSVRESELGITALAYITVLQGDPSQFQLAIPPGYEVTGASGSTLDASETQGNMLVLKVNAPAQRSHEFLISLERSFDGNKVDAPFLSFKDAQRETGEVLVEGAGTMELTATEGGGLKRMDIREISPYLHSLARSSLQAAFRYHRQPEETPTLALEWARFPDSSVLAAVAERADVTTLVTTEGKSLTEVKLLVRNQAQPFLKVSLPAGATIVSADVAGQAVKPVQGKDGNRVPLLRPNFRPKDAYEVSFVFMHSGAPFAKKGGAELSLPQMDVPVTLMTWEVFLPEQYKIKDFGGDVIAANLLPVEYGNNMVAYSYAIDGQPKTNRPINGRDVNALVQLTPGVTAANGPGASSAVIGSVRDQSGAVIAGAIVTATDVDRNTSFTAVSNDSGAFSVPVPPGRYKVTVEKGGFKHFEQSAFSISQGQAAQLNTTLNVGNVTETVEVTAAAPSMVETQSSSLGTTLSSDEINGEARGSGGSFHGSRKQKKPEQQQDNFASENVLNLQKRVAGVLPVRVDVPRTGTSYRFVRPLVLDEETKVTFAYKTK